MLEKKPAVVQRLFQWVGIWCVHTHYVALSDIRRARGRGYRQVRVPGASAGDISYGIEPSTRPTIRTEPTAGDTTPLTRQHRRRRVVGQPFVPSPRGYAAGTVSTGKASAEGRSGHASQRKEARVTNLNALVERREVVQRLLWTLPTPQVAANSVAHEVLCNGGARVPSAIIFTLQKEHMVG